MSWLEVEAAKPREHFITNALGPSKSEDFFRYADTVVERLGEVSEEKRAAIREDRTARLARDGGNRRNVPTTVDRRNLPANRGWRDRLSQSPKALALGSSLHAEEAAARRRCHPHLSLIERMSGKVQQQPPCAALLAWTSRRACRSTASWRAAARQRLPIAVSAKLPGTASY
jgi:hypothetical protein